MDIDQIVAVGDAAVRQLEEEHEERPTGPYREQPELRRGELEEGVDWLLRNPASSYAMQHTAWCDRNKYRLDRDDRRLVHYDQLDPVTRMKVRLWRAVVHAIVDGGR